MNDKKQTEVKNVINAEICEIFCIDGDEFKITEDMGIFDDLGADTLDLVELMMSLEDIFSMSIPEDVCDSIKTVKDIYEIVFTELEKQKS